MASLSFIPTQQPKNLNKCNQNYWNNLENKYIKVHTKGHLYSNKNCTEYSWRHQIQSQQLYSNTKISQSNEKWTEGIASTGRRWNLVISKVDKGDSVIAFPPWKHLKLVVDVHLSDKGIRQLRPNGRNNQSVYWIS